MPSLSDPLRQLIQKGVDHGFYRPRYDARRTLDAFSAWAWLREERAR